MLASQNLGFRRVFPAEPPRIDPWLLRWRSESGVGGYEVHKARWRFHAKGKNFRWPSRGGFCGGNQWVPHGKTYAILPRLILGQALPEEGVVSFHKWPTVDQPGFLETGNVDVESCQLLVDDGSLRELLQINIGNFGFRCRYRHFPIPIAACVWLKNFRFEVLKFR